jgi:uncharacterized lipoprotein
MEKSIFAAIITFTWLFVGCATTPMATWKSLPDVTGSDYNQAWAVIVGTITEKYYEIQVADATTGYLRTAWKQNSGIAIVTAYATRVTVQLESKKPLKFKVLVEKGSWGTFSAGYAPAGNDEKLEKIILDELTAKLKK